MPAVTGVWNFNRILTQGFTYHYNYLDMIASYILESLTEHPDRWIQVVVALATLLAVLVALFGEKLLRQLGGPKISISYNKTSERCLRWAILHQDHIQDSPAPIKTRRWYHRLRVCNHRGYAKGVKIKIDILNTDWQEVGRFEPTPLEWITGEGEINLAKDEAEYVNFLSQIQPSHFDIIGFGISKKLRVEIKNTKPRGIAWDRPLDVYHYKIIIYGENVRRSICYATFKPNNNEDDPGKIILGLAPYFGYKRSLYLRKFKRLISLFRPPRA